MKSLLEKSEDFLSSETDKLIYDSFLAYLDRLNSLIESEEETGGKEKPFVIAQIFEEWPGTTCSISIGLDVFGFD